jgi:hypothetical protein
LFISLFYRSWPKREEKNAGKRENDDTVRKSGREVASGESPSKKQE